MLQKDNRYKILSLFFDNPIPSGIGFQLREISRKAGIAPTSVKRYLNDLKKEGLVLIKNHRIHSYPVYYANRDSEYFKFLKKLNTIMMIKESGLLDYLFDQCIPDTIVLFGSASKGEDLQESDLDIYLQCEDQKLVLEKFEKQLNRKINPFFAKSFIKLSKELRNNVINGVILKGFLKVF